MPSPALLAVTAALLATSVVRADANTTSSLDADGDHGRVARAARLGELLGPRAAEDALDLLGAGEAQLTRLAPRPADRHPDLESPDGSSATSRTTVRLRAGEHVEVTTGPRSVQLDQARPGARQDTASVSASGEACPVVGEAWFMDTWAAARSGGRTHEGTDIFADRGAPVVAVSAGVVVKVDSTQEAGELGGLTVSYVTAAGDRWYNAHLDTVEPGLSVGDFVTAGEQVGTVGTSGNAAGTPPHLHIERHPGGGEAAPNFEFLDTVCR